MRRRYFTPKFTPKYNTNKYLTIIALSDEVVIKFSSDCLYKIDNSDWVFYEAGCEVKINIDSAIYFKGSLIPNGQSGIGRFTISGSCKLDGNCLSMLYFDEADKNSQVSQFAFSHLFAGCNSIVSVSNNFLSATTLEEGCYDSMFYGCTNLTTAPELPATTLAGFCYASMFYNCTSLTTAPELPATTLTTNCYEFMFYGCRSLTTAPELPATTLAKYCYYYMFYDCTKLNYIKMLATDISATNCLTHWVDGVASRGTFVKNKNATWNVTGVNGVPSGWTVVNDGEESNGNLITFTVGGVEYQAEKGMTWEEWINSSYYDQNLNITIKTDDRLYIDGDPIFRNSLQGSLVQYTTTEIIVNGIYNSM